MTAEQTPYEAASKAFGECFSGANEERVTNFAQALADAWSEKGVTRTEAELTQLKLMSAAILESGTNLEEITPNGDLAANLGTVKTHLMKTLEADIARLQPDPNEAETAIAINNNISLISGEFDKLIGRTTPVGESANQ